MGYLLFLNEGTGNIGQFRTTETGKEWHKVAFMGEGWSVAAVGDFNGDSTCDILVFNEATRAMGYYDMADGTPTWTGLDALQEGWTIEGTGDFDGDGNDEAALSHEDGSVARLVIDGDLSALIEIGSAGSGWDIIV